MPHKCRNCSNVIPNESESLLEGCPDCGNQSWEYVENRSVKSGGDVSVDEDKSQKDARTNFVDSDNLPSPSIIEGVQNTRSSKNNQQVKTINNISQIQEQLNKQYEGIKVVRNGKYKINLTELYRGNDYIIEIGEDGTYEVKKATKM